MAIRRKQTSVPKSQFCGLARYAPKNAYFLNFGVNLKLNVYMFALGYCVTSSYLNFTVFYAVFVGPIIGLKPP